MGDRSKSFRFRLLCIVFVFLFSLNGCVGAGGAGEGESAPSTTPITVNSTFSPLAVGSSETFVATSSEGDSSFTWDSTDDSVATVNGNGKVKAVGRGEANIRATGDFSGRRGSAKVKVVAAVASIMIWDGEISFDGKYGNLNGNEVFRGAGCFEALPDPYYSPTITLTGLESYLSNLSGFDEIWMFAKTDLAGVLFDFSVGGGPYLSNGINISNYIEGATSLDGQYRLVRIPVQQLKTADYGLESVEALYFRLSNTTDVYSVFIDDIWAVSLDTIDPSSLPLVGSLPAIAFGDVSVSSAVQTSLTVSNVGTATLDVAGVSISGTNADRFGVSGSAFSVAPGATHNLTVSFSPNVAGDQFATLTLTHNLTAMGSTSTVPLSGRAVDSGGGVPPTSTPVTVSSTFSPLPVGSSETFVASSEGDVSFIWASSNDSVATVSSDGTVLALAVGTATITATGTLSGETGSAGVTVVPAVVGRVIWDGEISFDGEYGNLNGVQVFRGAGCFEGLPDPYHSPKITLTGLESYRSDFSGYDEIWFFAKTDLDGVSFDFNVGGWPYLSNGVNISNYISGATSLDGNYRLIRIPVADLKTADYGLESVEALYFGPSNTTDPYSIFIDDVWAVSLTAIDPSNSPLMGSLPAIVFADTSIGSAVQTTVTVSNVGTATLDVANVSISGTNADPFGVSESAFSVAPGATHNLTVSFSPNAAGDQSATLRLTHNLTAMGFTSTVPLSGRGVGSSLQFSSLGLSSGVLDFGGVPVGQSGSQTLTVTNSGNMTLHVASMAASDPTFAITPSTYDVLPGGSLDVSVSFTPVTVGDVNASLVISSDASSSGDSVLLSASGLAVASTANLVVVASAPTSSGVTLSWGTYSGADEVKVYIGPEPSATANGALPLQSLQATLAGTAANYRLTNIAPTVNVFIRVEILSGGVVIASGNSHFRTGGGPRAQLDSKVRAVHAYAPNVLLVVTADEWVQSYEGTSGTLVGFTGPSWDSAAGWTITRDDNSTIAVTDVHRHSIPMGHPEFHDIGFPNYADVAQAFASENTIVAVDHRMYLVLGEPLGSRDVLSITGPLGTSFTLPFSDYYLETPVMQVNQVGYSPQATERYAYVSGWMGDGGPLALMNFPSTASVIEDPADALAVRNEVVGGLGITLRSASDVDAGTEVRQIDLSSVPAAEATVYRVRIPGVGVSWPTQVSHTAMFKAYYTVTRGMYYNRWGRDLQANTTEWGPRPPDHPTVYTAEKLEWGFGGGAFHDPATPQVGERLLAGGHHDAGDFDIQMIHYLMPILLMRAYEGNPAAYSDGQLTIPESGNGIPDILDEALWNLAGWEALQEADGGVRAGVESFGHPPAFYYSDLDSMPYWTYSRAPHHTARMAGLFAWASRLVEPFDAAKAAELSDRAIRAFDFARAAGVNEESAGTMLLSASEMFRTFGDTKYSNLFESTVDRWVQYPDEIPMDFRMPRPEAVFPETFTPLSPDFWVGYATTPSVDTSKWYSSGILAELTTQANDAVNEVETYHAHRNGRPPTHNPDWASGTAIGEYMLRIYSRLQLGGLSASEQQSYMNAISLSADYMLGCNPNGMVWVTGLGSRYPTDPLHHDALTFLYDGYGLMPGISVFGPTAGMSGASYYDYGENVSYPAILDQPLMRRFVDLRTFVIHTEGTMIVNAYHSELLGFLLPSTGMVPPGSWLPGGAEHRNTLAPREDATP